MRKLKCILLVDDNPNDNFFHERVIKKCNAAEVVVVKQSGKSALEYLRSNGGNDEQHPNLIFLDVNMPGMNGWEFLEEYQHEHEISKSGAVVVILSTSENPDDHAEALRRNADFMTKPLTPEALRAVMARYPNM